MVLALRLMRSLSFNSVEEEQEGGEIGGARDQARARVSYHIRPCLLIGSSVHRMLRVLLLLLLRHVFTLSHPRYLLVFGKISKKLFKKIPKFFSLEKLHIGRRFV